MTDLSRFHKVQQEDYPTALAEIRRGRKKSHWIWYIFPQLRGLGGSPTADYYGIDGIEEARAYLADPVLRAELVEISSALLDLPGGDIRDVMDYPDDMKLRSSMTLFCLASRSAEDGRDVFQAVLDKYFGGEPDPRTVQMLSTQDDQNT